MAFLVNYCFLLPFINSTNDSFSISLLQIEERPEKDFEKVSRIFINYSDNSALFILFGG